MLQQPLMLPFYIDRIISLYLNQFAHQNPRMDHFMYMISENKLLKGGVIMAVFYGLWWSCQENRGKLFLSILAAFVAEIGTIILSLTLPYRARPFTGVDIPFKPPVAVDIWWNNHISSFPSDHATLFTVMGLGIYSVHKKLGTVVLLYILLFVFFPRIYLGLHYFSDLLAGLIIGTIVFVISLRWNKTQQLAAKVLQFANQKPQYFYPLLFLISYQLVDLFTETREILGFIRHPFKY